MTVTSQILGRFAASMNLGPTARRELVMRYGSATTLPDWLTEQDDDAAEPETIRSSAPLPGQRYKHGWIPIGGVPGPHDARPALASATTTDEVGAALAAGLHGITGRNVDVDFTGADPHIAREYAEGILRGQERFPAAPLTRVAMSDHVPFAETANDGFGRDSINRGAIYFGRAVAADRDAMDAGLRDLHSENLAMANAGPVWIALHEFGHVANNYSTRGLAWPHIDFASRESSRIVREHMESQGLDGSSSASRSAFVTAAMSAKATQSEHELVAEAMTDAMLNGDRATPLSQDLMRAFEAEYHNVQVRQLGQS